MQIIAGLGNPRKQYLKTRHNVGFLFLDKIIKKKNLTWTLNKKFSALTAKDGDKLFVQPQTFMNNSGETIEKILSYYKLFPKKFGMLKEKDSDLRDILTLIHDDLDIMIGNYKEANNSRSGGHKGVESLIHHLKTKKFKRIRIGIKNELKNKIPTEKFVLMNFSKEENDIIEKIFDKLINEKFLN